MNTTNLTTLQYLNNLRPALPLSVEQAGKKGEPHSIMSNGELKRCIQQGSVLINGERVTPEEKVDFYVNSVVFFPKSQTKKTTIV